MNPKQSQAASQPRKALFSTILLSLGLMATGAQAAVVFNNGAPDQVSGVNMSANTVAEDFTTAADFTLSNIRFWSVMSARTDYGGAITVSIASNAGGLPGAVIASGTLSQALNPTGGATGFGYDEYVFDSPSSAVLVAGSYWLLLGASPLNPASPTEMLWETTATGHGATAQYFDAGLNDWVDSGQNLSFRIDGTPIDPNPNPTPEPATLALLAAGLLASRAARRKA